MTVRFRSCALPLLVVGLAVSSPAAAEPALDDDQRARFEQGNELYRRGDFAGARGAYRALVDAGVESPDVYYNLGNAALETGDLGVAIWAYLRAQAHAPHDDDVIANLTFARAKTLDAGPGAGEESWFLNQLAQVARRFPAKRLFSIAAVVYIALAAVCLVGWHRRRLPTAWIATLAAIWVVTLLSGVVRVGLDGQRGRVGVITAAQIDVRNEPGLAGKTVFSLHSGTEVVLMRDLGGWVEIALGKDLKGWIPLDDVAEV